MSAHEAEAGGDDAYYSHVRGEIAPLLPSRIDRVLEVGCGRGDTLAWIKMQQGAQFACGIELTATSAAWAATKADKVIQGDFERLEELPPDFKDFDVILCLDVLEHLVDPWKAVARLDALLKPGGVLIASIPNVRYFRVVLALVLQGRWEYRSSGILDRTHLRFFTKTSAIELMTSSGMTLERLESTGLERGRKTQWLNWATLSLFRPFFEYQYLIKVKTGNWRD